MQVVQLNARGLNDLLGLAGAVEELLLSLRDALLDGVFFDQTKGLPFQGAFIKIVSQLFQGDNARNDSEL